MFYEKKPLDFSSGAIDAEPADWGEIWDKSIRSVNLAGQAISQERALEESYDRRLQSIFVATGQRRDNPVRTYVSHDEAPLGVEAAPARDLSALASFQVWLEDLARQNPDKLEAIRPDLSPALEARRLAAEAESDELTAFERTPGIGKYVPYIGANLVAAATDPVNYSALVLGPFGAVGTGVKSVLWNGVKAGVANMAAETVAQPFVQDWRKSAGLSYGVSQAALQVGFAGVLGFAADAGIRGAYRGARRGLGHEPVLNSGGGVTGWKKPTQGEPDGGAGGPPPAPSSGQPLDALEDAALAAPEGSPLRRAAEGDEEALREVAELTGATQDPAVRGALAELERYKIFGPAPEMDRGEHFGRLAAAIRSTMDPEAIPVGEAIVGPAPSRTWPELPETAAAGTTETVDGKPVAYRAIDPKRTTEDGDVLASMRRGDGAAIAFETADGRFILQRQAARRLEGEAASPAAHVFREADGWTLDDARVFAARKSLEEQSGSPLDMAVLLRRRPDMADRTLPLTNYKFKQAIGLARLSDEAFGRVLAGEVPPHFAAIVGDQVADPGRHAGLLGELAGANLKSARAAKAFIGQALAGPIGTEAHAVRFGAGAAIRETIAERVAVIDQALSLLAKDKRVFSVLEREAPRIRRAGNVLDDEANVERQALADRLGGLVARLSEVPGRVNDLLQQAALEVAAGAKPRAAAQNFVRQVAEILEADGIAGLARVAQPSRADTVLNPAPMRDPFGPEAKAQTDGLKERASDRKAEATVDEGEVQSWVSTLAWLDEMDGIPKPDTLTAWLKGRGGLKDQGREISNMIGGARMRPGLINKTGMNLDDATLAAWQEGFLPGDERPDIKALLDALDDDIRSNTVVRQSDREILDDFEAAASLRREAEKLGLSGLREPDSIRAALARSQGEGSRSQGSVADAPSRDLRRASDDEGELDDVPFAVGAAQRARTAEMMLKMGRPVRVSERDVTALLEASEPHLERFIPEGTAFGVLERLDPLPAERIVKNVDTRATFRAPDGSTFTLDFPRGEILGRRALFHPAAGGRLVLTRLADQGQSEARLRGELAHEAVHAVYANNVTKELLVGEVGVRLVRHAEKLRVMDMDAGTFFRIIGEEGWENWPAGWSLRDQYEATYAARPNKQQLIDQEALAHMLELREHGYWLPGEFDPIISDLEAAFRPQTKKTSGSGTPDGPVFAIAGVKARTADLKALETAQRLEAEGVNYFKILQATGWERGADGQWKFEIGQRDARLAQAAATAFAAGETISARAVDVLDDPLVFEAFPELRRWKVILHRSAGASEGGVDFEARTIEVSARSPARAVEKLAHEFQHVIQRLEGFAEGGTPALMVGLAKRAIADIDVQAARALERFEAGDDAAGDVLAGLMAERDLLERQNFMHEYLRLAGEVEARNVERRLRMTRAERRNTSMRHTEDVPRDEQSVRRDGARLMLSEDEDAWHDVWFEQLSNRSALIDRAEWQKSAKAVPPDKRGKAAIEWAADDFRRRVSDYERSLWDAGETAEEIARRVSNKFDFDVTAEQVARREVWWRLDDVLSQRQTWTPKQDARLAELRAGGAKYREIAEVLNEEFGTNFTEKSINNRVTKRGTFAKRGPPVWTEERVKLLQAKDLEKMKTREIVTLLNELPGARVDATMVQSRRSKQRHVEKLAAEAERPKQLGDMTRMCKR